MNIQEVELINVCILINLNIWLYIWYCHHKQHNLPPPKDFLCFLLSILIPACASSSLVFILMYSAYKLNKHDDNIQPWHTSFRICNQSVAPCPVLTVAFSPAYRFLKRQVRWSAIPIFFTVFQSLLWSTQSNFPGGSDGKASAYNPGDMGLIPGSRRSSGEGNGNPLLYLPGKSHGQRSLVDCSPWGHKESDTTEWLHSLCHTKALFFWWSNRCWPFDLWFVCLF